MNVFATPWYPSISSALTVTQGNDNDNDNINIKLNNNSKNSVNSGELCFTTGNTNSSQQRNKFM